MVSVAIEINEMVMRWYSPQAFFLHLDAICEFFLHLCIADISVRFFFKSLQRDRRNAMWPCCYTMVDMQRISIILTKVCQTLFDIFVIIYIYI